VGFRKRRIAHRFHSSGSKPRGRTRARVDFPHSGTDRLQNRRWREMDSNNRFPVGRRSPFEIALLRTKASAISRLIAIAALRAAVERVGIDWSPIVKGSPSVVVTTQPSRLIPV
jgi:hypothetical protein